MTLIQVFQEYGLILSDIIILYFYMASSFFVLAQLSPNQLFLKLVRYYQMLLKSQLLFVSYARLWYSQYNFCVAKIATKNHQQNGAKPQMWKQTYTFLKVIKENQKVFKEEGLLNIDSSRIKDLLQQKTIEAVQIAKDWIIGTTQVDVINSSKFDYFLNFQQELFKLKNNYPEIQDMISKRDERTIKKLLQQKCYGLKKIIDFLIYWQKSRKQNIIESFRDKLNLMTLDESSRNNAMKEILKVIWKDDQLSDSFKKQLIQKITINTNINFLINTHIPLSLIPHKFYTTQRQLFFQSIRKRIQNEQDLKQLIVILRDLKQFSQDRLNISIIIIMINKLIKRIRDKQKCVKIDGAQFIQILIQDQQASLLFLYLIQNKLGSAVGELVDLKKYRPFGSKNWAIRFLLCILTHKKQKALEEQAILSVLPAFKDLTTFLSVYEQIRMINLQQFFPKIASYFLTQIVTLANPFLDRGKYTLKQKSLYLQFFFRSFHYTDKHNLVRLCRELITYEIKKQVIKYHLDQHCSLQPQKFCIYFANQGFDIALQKLDKEFLRLGIILLQKYQKIGVERTQDQYSQLKFWKLFRNYIENIDIIIQIGLGKQITEVLKSLITNNYKYYKQDYHYRQLLKKILTKLKTFEIYPNFLIVVLKAALNYPSILNPEVLKGIKVSKQSMKPEQYLKYLTIKGERTQLDILNEKNLSILFINQTYASQIKLHKTKIINIINCAKMSSIIESMNSFGMIPNKNSNEILRALLIRIVTDAIPTDLKGKIDLMGVFLNCLKNEQFLMIQFNRIWHLIIKIYLNDTSQLTIQMHIFLIQFAFTQSSNMLDNKLFIAYLDYDTVAYQSTELFLFYEIARSNMIKISRYVIYRIKILMKGLDLYHSKLKGTSLFIFFQQKLTEDEKKQQINKFIEYHKRQLTSSKQYKPFFYDLHYTYIKNKYPLLAQDLNLSQKHLQPYVFTMEYKIDPLFLKELIKELKTPLSYSLKFGANNIIQINDLFLVFMHPHKNSCLGQQKTIANIIESIHGKNCKVVFLIYTGSQTYEMEIIKNLAQNQHLLSKQSYERLKSLLEQKKTIRKPISVTYSYSDFIPQQDFEINVTDFEELEKDSVQPSDKQ